ncbi:hypothetical protein KKG41_00005 [Patescibacteria group bacterium]|nr:hypothetical protein [Patescibacteria group bacterium]
MLKACLKSVFMVICFTAVWYFQLWTRSMSIEEVNWLIHAISLAGGVAIYITVMAFARMASSSGEQLGWFHTLIRFLGFVASFALLVFSCILITDAWRGPEGNGFIYKLVDPSQNVFWIVLYALSAYVLFWVLSLCRYRVSEGYMLLYQGEMYPAKHVLVFPAFLIGLPKGIMQCMSMTLHEMNFTLAPSGGCTIHIQLAATVDVQRDTANPRPIGHEALSRVVTKEAVRFVRPIIAEATDIGDIRRKLWAEPTFMALGCNCTLKPRSILIRL